LFDRLGVNQDTHSTVAMETQRLAALGDVAKWLTREMREANRDLFLLFVREQDGNYVDE
jgi:hypothetical protein